MSAPVPRRTRPPWWVAALALAWGAALPALGAFVGALAMRATINAPITLWAGALRQRSIDRALRPPSDRGRKR